MGTKANLHRETLKAAPPGDTGRGDSRPGAIQLARMLNVFDKLQKTGMTGDAAVREAEKRLTIRASPKTSNADDQPIRRREPG